MGGRALGDRLVIVHDLPAGDGKVRTFAFDRPERRNALDRATLEALRDAIGDLDGGVRAVVITCSEGWFSAGADLKELRGDLRDVEYDDVVAAATQALTGSAVPVVAAIEEGCFGAAVDIAASCDIVVCDRGARLAIPAVRLGLLYNPAALARLTRRLSPGFAMRMLLAGDEVSTEDAAAGGLIDVLVDSGAGAEATRLAATIAANDPGAVRATLGLLRDARAGALDPGAWESRRRELLSSPQRRHAVERAQEALDRRTPDPTRSSS